MTLQATSNALRARRWLRNCAQVGSDPYLLGKPTIQATGGQVCIGDHFRLASRPVASHLVAGPGAILRIGNNVSIGCGAAVAAYQHVHIGDDTRIGPFVIIMDTNFHSSPGDQSVQHDCRPVIVGSGCRIGSRVTITRGVVIGDGAEILAGSVVTSAIPPGVCAAGGRARVIGRAGEVTSRSYSVVASLPDVLMEALDLESPPDLDAGAIPTHMRTDERMQGVIKVIEDRLGVVLNRDALHEMQTFGDIAGAVQQALNAKSA